jgi:hypothetical protein
MDWTGVMSSLGGVAGAVAALVSGLVSYRLNLKLQALKEDQEKKVAQLRIDHELAMQNNQIQANERMEFIKSAQEKVKRLESERLKRGEGAYEEIWTLTRALNLFGPANSVDCAKLSEDLTTWYFSKVQTLTNESKARYFLLQELLNFFRMRSITLSRPSDELLYSGESSTIQALRAYRAERLAIPAKGDEASYPLGDLETYVRKFKAKCNRPPEEVSPEDAWLLLQLVMSAFRSGITQELGSRIDALSSAVAEAIAVAEASRARGGL